MNSKLLAKKNLYALVVIVLIIFSAVYFKDKIVPKKSDYPDNVPPQLVDYVKTQLYFPKTFRHISTGVIDKKGDILTYVMEFTSKDAKGKDIKSDAVIEFDASHNKVITSNIMLGY